MSKFDTIGLINQSTLPSAVAGDVVFQASKLRVFNGSIWETFSAVSTTGDSNTITMGASQQFLGEGGSGNPNDGAPSYAFSGDTDTGIWNPADGRMRFAVNGSGSMELDNDGMELLLGAFQAPLGAAGTPSYSFTGDGNTGMWSPGSDQIAFGVGSITSALSIGSTGVLNVGASNYETLITNPNDIPNKAYVDAISAGLDPKEAVRITTASASEDMTLAPYNGSFSSSGGSHGNGSITGIDLSVATGGTIDGANYTGVSSTGLTVGDRVLIKNQGTALQNGIYVILAGSVTANVNMERAPDQDGNPADEISGGNFTFVEAGASLTGTLWTVVWEGTVNLNVDPMNWTQIGGAIAFPLLAPAGAAPQYSFSGDLDTGMASPSSDILNLIAGNTIGLQLLSTGPVLGANLDVSTFDIVSTGLNHIDIIAAANGSGTGRNVNVAGGQGSQSGGDVNLDGGVSGAGFDAGDVNINGGANSASVTNVGRVLILAGNSASVSHNPAQVEVLNSVTIRGRNFLAGAANNGGDVSLEGGQGYGTGLGGDVDIRGGNAGQASATPGNINLFCGGQTGGSSAGHIAIRCGETAAGVLQFREGTDGANFIGLKAADSLTGDTTYTLPSSAPVSDGDVLVSTTAGVMAWQTVDSATVLSVQTTDDTETELVGPSTTYYDIASGTTHAVEILVVGEKSDGSEAAMWKVLVGIKNVAGTTSLVGSDVTTTISNTPGWTLSVSADDTNDRLAVKVTGVAATTIDWKAKITSVQV